MATMITRPEFVTEEHLIYLDDLRESGIINMFGATPLIEDEFPALTHDQAKRVLTRWMRSFATRQEIIKGMNNERDSQD